MGVDLTRKILNPIRRPIKMANSLENRTARRLRLAEHRELRREEWRREDLRRGVKFPEESEVVAHEFIYFCAVFRHGWGRDAGKVFADG